MKFPISNSQFPIRKGFTLLELIIVISIVAIISTGGTAAFIQYSRSQTLEIAKNEVVSLLNAARSKSQSQVIPSGCTSNSIQGYQVRFDRNIQNPSLTDFNLEAVCNLSGGGIQTFPVSAKTLPSNISFSAGSAGLPVSFVFAVIKSTVSSNPAGVSAVTLTNSYNNVSKTIQILSNGSIIYN